MCGQIAISIRKCKEHYKDQGVANVQNTINQNNQAINNQRWNHLLCSNSGTLTIFLVLFLVLIIDLFLSKYIQNWWILNHFKLNKVETIQFSYMFYTFVYCVVIPSAIYARNVKLYKHVKNEISDFIYG